MTRSIRPRQMSMDEFQSVTREASLQFQKQTGRRQASLIDAPIIPDNMDLNAIQRGFVRETMNKSPDQATLDPFEKFTDAQRTEMNAAQKAWIIEAQKRGVIK